MANKIIHIGDTPPFQISSAAITGINKVLYDSFNALAVVIQGTAIRATTAGRRALKTFSTQTLSCIRVKNKAINRMIKRRVKSFLKRT